MSLPLFDHPASDGEQHLFKNHEILKPFFEEGLVSLDDTLKNSSGCHDGDVDCGVIVR